MKPEPGLRLSLPSSRLECQILAGPCLQGGVALQTHQLRWRSLICDVVLHVNRGCGCSESQAINSKNFRLMVPSLSACLVRRGRSSHWPESRIGSRSLTATVGPHSQVLFNTVFDAGEQGETLRDPQMWDAVGWPSTVRLQDDRGTPVIWHPGIIAGKSSRLEADVLLGARRRRTAHLTVAWQAFLRNGRHVRPDARRASRRLDGRRRAERTVSS